MHVPRSLLNRYHLTRQIDYTAIHIEHLSSENIGPLKSKRQHQTITTLRLVESKEDQFFAGTKGGIPSSSYVDSQYIPDNMIALTMRADMRDFSDANSIKSTDLESVLNSNI